MKWIVTALLVLLLISPALAADFGAVREVLDDAVALRKVAGGSVMVIHQGKVVLSQRFGYADVASKTPFRVDTPVVIASVGKPLLGTAAYRLAEQKKIDLTAPITNYLPEFADVKLESGERLTRPPTMIELMAHTSGIRYSESTGGRPWLAKWTGGKTLADVVKKYAREYPFEAQPGKRYAYSGIGWDVAARVLEVAAKQPRNEFLTSAITKPLGMEHTYFRDATSLKRIGKMPTRYYHKDGKIAKSRDRRVPPTNTYSSSGGSIISTAPDLARWLLMIRAKGKHEGKTILSSDTIAEMLSPQKPSSKSRAGFSIRKKSKSGKALVIGHTGSSGTNIWLDFEKDVIGIMLTQTRGKDIKPFRVDLEKRVNHCIDALR
ncbi:MAG: hypothetical protein CMJ78_04045 [Planctomycetaceae bacterium]|nr:hypothetical protein [Planctomycetaceae bacterium]